MCLVAEDGSRDGERDLLALRHHLVRVRVRVRVGVRVRVRLRLRLRLRLSHHRLVRELHATDQPIDVVRVRARGARQRLHLQGDVGRCGEMWRDVGRYGEM